MFDSHPGWEQSGITSSPSCSSRWGIVTTEFSDRIFGHLRQVSLKKTENFSNEPFFVGETPRNTGIAREMVNDESSVHSRISCKARGLSTKEKGSGGWSVMNCSSLENFL